MCNISKLERKFTFLVGVDKEEPCHVSLFRRDFGFFSVKRSKKTPSARSLNGSPVYKILAPDSSVLAIAATEGCACDAKTVSSHQQA